MAAVPSSLPPKPVSAGVEANKSDTSKPLHNAKVAQNVNNTSASFFLISGTSSAGKTSVMQAFCKNRSDTVRIGIDDFLIETYKPKMIQEHLPQDYNVLKDAFDDADLELVCHPEYSITEIIKSKPNIFKKDATPSQKEAASELLLNQAFRSRYLEMLNKHHSEQKVQEGQFDLIFQKFSQGKTVIFDTGWPAEFFEFIKSKGIEVKDKIHHVLVYLPFNELLGRVEKRNASAQAEGELINQRGFSNVIRCFTEHYRPVQTADDVVVDTLDRRTVEDMFKKYEAELKKEQADHPNENLPTLETFLKHFGFTAGVTQVKITPTPSQLVGILHSATSSPSESALQLRTKTFTKL